MLYFRPNCGLNHRTERSEDFKIRFRWIDKQDGPVVQGKRSYSENSGQTDLMNAKSFEEIGIIFQQSLRCGILQWKWLKDRPVLEGMAIPGAVEDPRKVPLVGLQ